jgi:hypothetical protein
MGLFDLFKKKPIALVSDEKRINDILIKLEELGYFKYANPADLEELKTEVYNSLKSNFLSTIWNEEKPYNSKDYRHYSLDNETLFEEGGFTDYLKDFDHLFKIIGLKLDIKNHVEEWNENESVNHTITINNKDYVIFKNFKGYGWGEASERFAEILNDQLKIQGKDERIFLASGGNDGQAIVLTEAQFNLLDPVLKNPHYRPLRIEDWCRVMEVKPVHNGI